MQKVLETDGREIGQPEDFTGYAASTKEKQIKDPHPPKPPKTQAGELRIVSQLRLSQAAARGLRKLRITQPSPVSEGGPEGEIAR